MRLPQIPYLLFPSTAHTPASQPPSPYQPFPLPQRPIRLSTRRGRCTHSCGTTPRNTRSRPRRHRIAPILHLRTVDARRGARVHAGARLIALFEVHVLDVEGVDVAGEVAQAGEEDVN